MTRVMIDSNVVIDYLTDRKPFAEEAGQVMKLSEFKEIRGMMTASSVTDIYYIIKKALDHAKAMELLKTLLSIVDLVEVCKQDILRAMDLPMSDFEDALVATCAKRAKADFIVTRNQKDFMQSEIPSLSPVAFLKRIDEERRRP